MPASRSSLICDRCRRCHQKCHRSSAGDDCEACIKATSPCITSRENVKDGIVQPSTAAGSLQSRKRGSIEPEDRYLRSSPATRPTKAATPSQPTADDRKSAAPPTADKTSAESPPNTQSSRPKRTTRLPARYSENAQPDQDPPQPGYVPASQDHQSLEAEHPSPSPSRQSLNVSRRSSQVPTSGFQPQQMTDTAVSSPPLHSQLPSIPHNHKTENTHFRIFLQGKPGWKPLPLTACRNPASFLTPILALWQLSPLVTREIYFSSERLASRDVAISISVSGSSEAGKRAFDRLLGEVEEDPCWEVEGVECIIDVMIFLF